VSLFSKLGLRIADGLDRSHMSVISTIRPEISGKTINLILSYRNEKSLSLDIWGAERKKSLFEEVFGYKVKFVF